MSSTSLRPVVERFRQTLVSQGLLAAMRVANAQSSHRFTAIYFFDGSMLRNLLLVDRDDPTVRSCPDLPVLESYCLYVREQAARFQVEASREDARVLEHPKREVVQSYCGIPIVTSDGALWGTICHFDYAPRPFAEDEVGLLEAVAPMVMRAIEDGTAGDLPALRRDSAA